VGSKRKREVLDNLFFKQMGTCFWCFGLTELPQPQPQGIQFPDYMATVEHIRPVSKGGALDGVWVLFDDIELFIERPNTVMACYACNTKWANKNKDLATHLQWPKFNTFLAFDPMI
jgi:hypothetical protein